MKQPAVTVPPIPLLLPRDTSVSSQTFKNRDQHLLTSAPRIEKKGLADGIGVVGQRKFNSSIRNEAIGYRADCQVVSSFIVL